MDTDEGEEVEFKEQRDSSSLAVAKKFAEL